MPERDRGVIRVDDGTSNAVLELLGRARQRIDAGDLDGAGVQLERALRIEPSNAVLWHYMARLRLNEGRLSSALQAAARSNSLAGADRRLLHDNWRLMAEAKRRSGDEEGAAEASARADSLQ